MQRRRELFRCVFLRKRNDIHSKTISLQMVHDIWAKILYDDDRNYCGYFLRKQLCK